MSIYRFRRHAPLAGAVLAAGTLLVATTATIRAQAPVSSFEQACATDNPFFVTTCYARGTNWDEPALVAFRDTRNNSGHIVLATMRDIGATYGVAYQPVEKALYVGAYHKRGSPFGPTGGPGTIYRIALTTGSVAPWLDVPGAGRDQHDRTGNYFPDTRARNFVGTLGLGDLDFNEDGTELYVMHLAERRIYRYRLADRQLLGRIEIGPAGEGWATQARPFGLKVWRGKLYHGVVNTAYQSQRRSELAAYVYESDLDGSNMRLVTQFSLDYRRGNVFGNVPARWWPWKDGYNSVQPGPLGAYPQPMLTDIEFSDSGDMILALRDRSGDMTFFDPGGRNPPGEGTLIPAGDILLARFNGSTWDAITVPEFFAQDAGPGLGTRDGVHDESSFGGLARVQRANIVVNTALAPERISSGGAYWYELSTGRNTAREEIYNIRSRVNFGKANGLGDVEILCGPAERTTPTPTATQEQPTATDTPTATTTTPPTVTATATITPTATATITATVTATITPTATVTSRPTASVTPSTTASPGPTASLTPTGTMTATLTAPPPSPTAPPTPLPTATTPPTVTTAPTAPPTAPPTSPPEVTPAPSPTPELPMLPKTGSQLDVSGLLMALGVLCLAVGRWVNLRLRRCARG